jgi:hypothetical protein
MNSEKAAEREWLLIEPKGTIVARESSCIRAWARIDGYKPTVEGLLGYEEKGWRVEPSAPQQAAEGALTARLLRIVQKQQTDPRMVALTTATERYLKSEIDRLHGAIAALARQAGTADEAAPSAAKPVAWRFKSEPAHSWSFTDHNPETPSFVSPTGWGNAGHWKIWEPLYAAAQAVQPEPLTDERLFELLAALDAGTVRLPPGFKQFARAIEAAHGIASHPTGKEAIGVGVTPDTIEKPLFLASPPDAGNAGMVLSDEPTDEQIRTGVKAFQSGFNGFDNLSDWRAFYRTVRATLAASTPKEQSE